MYSPKDMTHSSNFVTEIELEAIFFIDMTTTPFPVACISKQFVHQESKTDMENMTENRE